MSHISQTETSAEAPVNDGTLQADAMIEAITADSDRLYAIVQNCRDDVLLAALRNPVIDRQHILMLLKRRGIETAINSIYASKRLIEAHSVKLALVAHPDTPSHIAQTLLPMLYIFDLLKLCYIPGTTADIHQAAERRIIQQIATQPLGNKLTLARRGTAAILDALFREGLPSVMEACLDNPHMKEGTLHQFLISSLATAENISVIARSNRWKNRPDIRLAILKNPRTPLIWYTLFLPGMPASALRDLALSPRLTPAQKELIRQTGRNSRR